jgi:hypothetical protein
MLSQIPGWTRSRRFRLASASGDGTPAYTHLALHEFRADNGLEGPEHARARSTPWRTRIMDRVRNTYRRNFELYHIFSSN